jgi:hypothetical protein
MQNQAENYTSLREEWLTALLPLLLLALGLRLLVFSHLRMLNPDGMVYILQAKALYLHQSDKLLQVYPWPTNLAFFLAGAYHLVGDWILAGRLVSLGFSLATIIPLYFFYRRYLSRMVTAALVLFYVASPTFVEYSSQILRGPEFWFFFCAGLWGYGLLQTTEKSRPGICFLTSSAFLLAAWSRIEGLLPLLLATGGVLLSARRHGWRGLAAYFAPYAAALAVAFLPLFSWQTVSPNNNLFKIIYSGLVDRISAAWSHFTWLKNSLRELQKSPPFGVAPYFFKELRHHLFFLALGITGYTLARLFGLPYLATLVIGRFRRQQTATPAPDHDTAAPRPPRLLLLTAGGGILIIYIEVLLRWASSPRFAALVFFPALIFAAPGCRWLLELAGAGGKNPEAVAKQRRNLLLFGLLLALICLPSTLKKSRTERSTAFKEIGLELAGSRLTEGAPLKLCGTSRKILYTHFFAYLDKAEILSPEQYCTVYYIRDLDLDTLIRNGCTLLLLSDRDHGRQRFREKLQKRNDLSVSVICERSNTELHGRVTLYKLSRRN